MWWPFEAGRSPRNSVLPALPHLPPFLHPSQAIDLRGWCRKDQAGQLRSAWSSASHFPPFLASQADTWSSLYGAS